MNTNCLLALICGSLTFVTAQLSAATLIVDKTTGPYTNLISAKNAANNGDLILVHPGVYSETDLLKNGVNWHFFAGAIISNLISTATGVFTDNGNAVTSIISGELEISHVSSYQPPRGGVTWGVIQLSNSLSVLRFAAKKIFLSDNAHVFDNSALCGIAIKKCRMAEFDIGHILDQDASGGISYATMVYWEDGETFIRCNKIEASNGWGVWMVEPAAGSSANLHLEAQLIQSSAWSAVRFEGRTEYWKAWISAKEIQGASTGAEATIWATGGGKIYVYADKISDIPLGNSWGAVVVATNTQAWITAQKISGTRFVYVDGAILYCNALHYEDSGTIAGFWFTNHSRAFISGQVATVKNGVGIVHAGGTNQVEGLKVIANDHAAYVRASGLILKDCVLVGPSSAKSIYAPSKQTVRVYGTTSAKRAKHANVKVSVGTLKVNSAVE
jgi:hypothetical protein